MVWYGMVVYQKDAKTCEGSPLSALQAYNQIISLWFSYNFPSCSMLFPIIFHISLFFPYCSLLFLLFTYYFPLSSLFLPYYFPIYNFLILPYYCPICLPGFQNDKLRHLEGLCFDCHAECLKPAKIHIIWFPTKILDFTVFWWHFPKKRLSKPKNDDPSRLFSLFCSSTCYPFDGHAKCMKPAETHKLNCNTFAAPKKWLQLSLQDFNREQLGKYTGKLLVTTDPGIRVWYGMVWWFTRKMAKPVESHHFQGYKHITRLFPIYFPIISRVVPYYIGETWRNHILSVENLLNISKLKKMTGAEFFDVFASF